MVVTAALSACWSAGVLCLIAAAAAYHLHHHQAWSLTACCPIVQLGLQEARQALLKGAWRLAQTVERAHAVGVVIADIKPSQVLLDCTGCLVATTSPVIDGKPTCACTLL
jgi:hypothetical protein